MAFRSALMDMSLLILIAGLCFMASYLAFLLRKGDMNLLGLVLIIIFIIFSTFGSSSLALGQQNSPKLTLSLDRAINLALANNDKIRQAYYELKAAEARLKVQNADRNPQIGLTSFYNQRKNDDSDNPDEQKSYSTGFSFSQILARFGELPQRVDIAQEDYRKAQLAYEAANREVISEVRRIFYNITLIQEEITEREKLEDSLQEKLTRAKGRYEAGILLKINVLNAELELTEQRLELNELQRRIDVTHASLLKLIGENPLTLKEVTVAGGVLEEEFTLDEAVETALKNRLELLDLRGLIARQERLVVEAKWNQLPKLTAKVRRGDAAISIEQHNLTWDVMASLQRPIFEKEVGQSSKFEPEPILVSSANKGWEVSFDLRLPIFDGSFTKSKVEAEEAKLAELFAAYHEKQKGIAVEVIKAYRNVASLKEKMELQEKVVQIRRENLRLIESLLETPLEAERYRTLTFDDVIRSRSDFTESQRLYFQARREYAFAKEELRQIVNTDD